MLTYFLMKFMPDGISEIIKIVKYPAAADILRMMASSSRREAAKDKEEKLINDGIL